MSEDNSTHPEVPVKPEQDKDITFEEINPETHITEIESMCVNCEKNGMTKYVN